MTIDNARALFPLGAIGSTPGARDLLAGTAAPRWSPDNRRIIFAGATPPPRTIHRPPHARRPTASSGSSVPTGRGDTA